MSATNTKTVVKQAVRELKGLRTADRNKAAGLNGCHHHCCRRRQA